MKITLLFVLFFISASSTIFGQNDTISIVSYNLLNFPDGRTDCGSANVNPSNRTDTLRKILGYLKPDIFVACEIQTKAGADSVLTRSLNVFGTTDYGMAPFQYSGGGGGGLNNAMFYNSNKVTFLRQRAIQTSSRDINHYTLCAKDPNLSQHRDTIFIDVYMSHLKAGSASADQAERAQQTQIFRTYVDSKPLMRNHIICGDMNVYKSSEACYQNLLTGGLLPFIDPINTPGDWNNNSSFAAVHTQSSRASGSYACGSTGGLDDRFDQILTTPNVLSGTDGLYFVPNSYKAVGNDGLHFNNSIWGGAANLQYPDSVLRALYYMSDHLPVTMKVIPYLPTTNGLALTYSNNGPLCLGNSNGEATVTPLLGTAPFNYLWDSNAGSQTSATATGLNSGSYCVTVTDVNGLSDIVCFEIEGIPGITTGVFTTNATGICDGEAIVLVNGGTPPYSFLWNDPLAQTTQSAVGLCPGNYTCSVSDNGNCFTSVPVIISGPVGLLEKLIESQQLSIYPNPLESELSLLNSSNQNLRIDELDLSNLNGKEVATFNKIVLNSKSTFRINTENLPKGLYFLRVNIGGSSTYFKVIK
jgi:hypothetical protein